ncbi:MAG: ATP-binding cassette domain-containing protein [Desulfobacterium sp.]|nr:ATP-binding cassette domain-containing protein [Desulfobacterium sp.]
MHHNTSSPSEQERFILTKIRMLPPDKIAEIVNSVDFISQKDPSGCGKSTVLRITAGLKQASTGTVHYAASPVTKPCAEIGLVFQKYSLFPWMTVLDNREMGNGMGKSQP